MRFECTLKYRADDLESPNPRRKKFECVIACEAATYGDAEMQATQWGMENIEEEFQVSPIKELSVAGIYMHHTHEGKWFNMACEFYVTEMNGKVKTNKINYLVQAGDQYEALDRTRQIMYEEGFEAFEIKKTTETKISLYLY